MRIEIDTSNLTDMDRKVLALLAGTATAPAAPAPAREPQPETPAAEGPAGPEPTDTPAETDKDGLPWDERIHSSNHKMTAAGVWQLKRGVDKDLVEQVRAELLGNTVDAGPTPDEAFPVATTAAAPPPPPPAADEATRTSFADIMRRVTAAQKAGVDTKPLLEAAGVEKVVELNTNTDARDTMAALLEEAGH